LSETIIPGTSGFATVAQNFGALRNTGLETQLFATPINTGKFRWTIQANLTLMRNKFTEINEEPLFSYADIGSLHQTLVGYPIGTFVGIEAKGVNPDTGEMEYVDENNDGTIDDNDAKVLGYAYPNVYGGLTFNFQYKKFDFNIANSFSWGNKTWNYNKFIWGNMGYSDEGWDEDNNLHQIFVNTTKGYADKRWQKPGDVTDIPRASLLTQPYIENSSAMLEDASYWKVRTINLGYTFSRPAGKRWFSSATAGLDYATYPQARTTMIGINLTF
jgi:TonB-dependent starch-binding outer membrane protein SusC